MIFGEFALDDAEGLILAHTLNIAERTLRKGRALTLEDIADLQQFGMTHVWGGRLQSMDVEESAAAGELAQALAGANVRPSNPATGHCNLLATADGLLETDPDLINRFNRIDPEIKLATAPNWAQRKSGAIMARIKVIPFAVARERLDFLLRQVQAWQLRIGVAALRQFDCTLVMTQLPGTGEERLTQTEAGIGQRLRQVNNALTRTTRCAHTLRGISEALKEAVEQHPDLVLIASASATVDLVDVCPCAIEEAGGRIIQYGFPLEPGSLLVMAEISDVPILVLPGCARSGKPNGIDRLLQRFAADRMPTADEMLDWGCGGLLPGQKT